MVVPGMYLADRYEILEKIGSGGMADVYKARDHKLNRLVAVKVLKQEFSVDETFVKKFRVEAQAAAGLSHPNIVNVYDVGEENGIHYIVMELVQGITLKKYIEMKGKLEIKEALNISVQIASGLQAAHDNRIIHRDIKPQNIIMSRDGKVKVTDFGIAKMADSTTVTTNAAGSVHYISPEQARGGYSDAKSDIYSLGITMYEMLTGRVPFEGETNVAVALLHIQGEMVPPRKLEPSIPRSFEKIILKCTQKKPERRYASARDLIADLRKVLTHPDGEYVNLTGAPLAANEQTVVLNNRSVGAASSRPGQSLASGSPYSRNGAPSSRSSAGSPSSAHSGAAPSRPSSGSSRPAEGAGQSNRQYAGKNGQHRSDYEEDEDEDGVNPALEKVMMVLGIVGAVILVVVIFFIIGRAAGLFSGNGQTESAIESMSESQTESQSDTQSAEEVQVPDLYDMTQQEAQSELRPYGLYLSIQNGASDDVEEGHIYRQSPTEGTTLSRGDTVTVWINMSESETEEQVQVPDVTDYTYNQASTALEAQGLAIAGATYENSDDVAADRVTRTDPAAGTSVDPGTKITLYISKGPEEKTTTMPQVVGTTLADARTLLAGNNLTVGQVTYEPSDSVAEGRVIRASVSRGETVDEGTAVDLVISEGPAETESQSQSQSQSQSSYTGTIDFSSLGNPIGGLSEGQTSTVLVNVYNASGAVVWTTGNMTMGPDDWVSQYTVTSTNGEPVTWEVMIDGQSIGTGPVNMS